MEIPLVVPARQPASGEPNPGREPGVGVLARRHSIVFERRGFARPAPGQPGGMTPEREEDEPDDLDELVDEFGDRTGPDPAREPELELGEDETIVAPAEDE